MSFVPFKNFFSFPYWLTPATTTKTMFKKSICVCWGEAAFGYLADEGCSEFRRSQFREPKTLAACDCLWPSPSGSKAEAIRGGCGSHSQTAWAFVLSKRTSDFVSLNPLWLRTLQRPSQILSGRHCISADAQSPDLGKVLEEWKISSRRSRSRCSLLKNDIQGNGHHKNTIISKVNPLQCFWYHRIHQETSLIMEKTGVIRNS